MNLFVGVVENNLDPYKLFRCQVRIFGKHTDDRTILPVDDLPWAISTVKNLKNGEWVIINFLDTEEQKPVILGRFPRFVENLPNFNVGFSDPNGEFPSDTNEATTSRLERNENINETIIQSKKDGVKTGVSCAGTSWNEPETKYNAEYPKNNVIETKYHVIELDDTERSERIHIYHKTGSFIEFHPNGDEVEVIKAKKFMIVESDSNIFVGGNENKKINGNENKSVGGTSKESVNAKEIESSGNCKITVGGNVEINASGMVKIVGATINLN